MNVVTDQLLRLTNDDLEDVISCRERTLSINGARGIRSRNSRIRDTWSTDVA